MHPYGLADLEEPFWSSSTWYRRGDAVVAVLDLGGDPVVYAIAADDDGDGGDPRRSWPIWPRRCPTTS